MSGGGTMNREAAALGVPVYSVFRGKLGAVDQIFNLACPASPIHYQNGPVQTTKVNLHGAINVLGLAKRVRAKILQASSGVLLGERESHRTEGLLRRGQAVCGNLSATSRNWRKH